MKFISFENEIYNVDQISSIHHDDYFGYDDYHHYSSLTINLKSTDYLNLEHGSFVLREKNDVEREKLKYKCLELFEFLNNGKTGMFNLSFGE